LQISLNLSGRGVAPEERGSSAAFRRGSRLVQEIGVENNRWVEFNQRLEELERTLGRR